MDLKKIRSLTSTPVALCFNLLLVYVSYTICRLVFLWVNHSYFKDLTLDHFWEMYAGGLVFDTSAIIYTNALYIVLTLFPFHYKENKTYYAIVKWLFIIINMICIVMNLMDTVYFQYTNKRTTSSVFSQFSNEDNIAKIVGLELLNHWYLLLLAVGFCFALVKLYRKPNEIGRAHV